MGWYEKLLDFIFGEEDTEGYARVDEDS